MGGFLKRFIEKHDKRETTYITKMMYKVLKHQLETMLTKVHKFQKWIPDRRGQLAYFPSSELSLEIIDINGVILGYQFRLGLRLITVLEKSEAILPAMKT